MGNKRTPRKKLDRFLVECPMCGNVPPKLTQDFNGYYYFECDNKDCKVGTVIIYTKGLKELVSEGKHKKLFDSIKKTEKPMKTIREKMKGTSRETIDWQLVTYIILAALGILYLIFTM